MNYAVAVAFLLIIGWSICFPLIRSHLSSVVLSPLGAGLVCALGGTLAVALRLGLGVAVVSTWVILCIAAWLLTRNSPSTLPLDRTLTVITVVGLAPFLTLLGIAPIGWDARSYWWLHAEWLLAGGEETARLMGSDVFAGFHPDYPPLASATVASVWALTSGTDEKTAQLVTTILTFSSICAVVMFLFAVFPNSISKGARRTLALVVGAVGFLMSGPYATNGFVDTLWAACFTGAAVLLLLSSKGGWQLRIGCLLVAVASLTKNEGLIASFLLLGVFAVASRSASRTCLVALSLIPGLIWQATARSLGAVSDLGVPRISGLLGADRDVLSRFSPTLTALSDYLAAPLAVMLVLMITSYAFDRESFLKGRWMVVLTLGYALALFFVYFLGNREIHGHLASSVDRTTVSVRLMTTATMAYLLTGMWGRVMRRQGEPVGQENERLRQSSPAVYSDLAGNSQRMREPEE